MPNTEPTEPSPQRRPFQFGLGVLLLIMVLTSVLAAALGGMLRGQAGESPLPSGFFVLMAVAAPVAVLILLSLIRAIAKRLRGWR